MANYNDAATRWLDIELGKSNRQPLQHRRMPVRDGRIFSYGSHFELARVLRDKKNRPTAILLNGENFSQTTSQHQRIVRNVSERSGLPTVIIPHEALFAAGIDRDSVQIIEVTDDRFETTEHRAYEQPAGSRWLEVGTTSGAKAVLLSAQHSRIDVEVLDDGRTAYSWTTSRHWLGESLIRARSQWRDRTTGTIKSRWSYYLSGFDFQERIPAYFFCELPRSKPTTIAEAYEILKPDVVKLAEVMNRTVRRQGDIFAVALDSADKRTMRKAGARFEKRGTLLNTNHVASEVAYLPNGTTLVRGTLTHAPQGRAPDHRRVTLDKGWHIVTKNTVPIAV